MFKHRLCRQGNLDLLYSKDVVEVIIQSFTDCFRTGNPNGLASDGSGNCHRSQSCLSCKCRIRNIEAFKRSQEFSFRISPAFVLADTVCQNISVEFVQMLGPNLGQRQMTNCLVYVRKPQPRSFIHNFAPEKIKRWKPPVRRPRS